MRSLPTEVPPPPREPALRDRSKVDAAWQAENQAVAMKSLESAAAWFILVSVLDVFMTMLLLYRGNFQEANPVARFFLNHWGPRGMVYFKFAMVAVVCSIAWYIARHRPETAHRLLRFALLVVAGVVVYSVALLVRHY